MSKKETPISPSVIHRLPRYYRFLKELESQGTDRISSRELAERMGLTASQIRQDFNCFGEFGQQGYGYSVSQLSEALRHILSMNVPRKIVLIGAGHLGQAVAGHMDFEGKQLMLSGIFDDAPALIGTKLRGVTVTATTELESFCREHRPVAAILCVPKEAAPELAKRLVACGVRAFWNFSHFDIARAYPDVVVENVHLGDSLMVLTYLLGQQEAM